MPNDASERFDYGVELPEDVDNNKEEMIQSMGLNDNSYPATIERRHLRANSIYMPVDMQYDTQFYRMRRIDPYFQVEGGTEYLFFTKPDLNLVDSGCNLVRNIYNNSSIYGLNIGSTDSGPAVMPYFSELLARGYRQTFSDLCYSARVNNDSCPFVRILSNRKVSNMDVPDIVTNEIETAQNMFGTRLFYPTSSMKSDEDVEFSIEFEDTQFLEVYYFFKTLDMYRQAKYLGIVAPTDTHIRNKILSDHMSIFKFIVDTDGETILYYAKATGVYPKTISRSAFSEIQDKGGLKITVSFKLSGWFEDMEPNIITDFNQLVYTWVGNNIKEQPIWDEELQAVSGENIKYFYVDTNLNSCVGSPTPIAHKMHRYLLKAGQ